MHGIWRTVLPKAALGRSLFVTVLDSVGHATRAGAEVRVYAAGTHKLVGARIVDSGSGYNAQNVLPVHFGIPGGGRVDIEVTWPANGARSVSVKRGVDVAALKGKPVEIRTLN
jgi:hypothetical protein